MNEANDMGVDEQDVEGEVGTADAIENVDTNEGVCENVSEG